MHKNYRAYRPLKNSEIGNGHMTLNFTPPVSTCIFSWTWRYFAFLCFLICKMKTISILNILLFFFFFFFFGLFRAVGLAYGSSQARGQIRAAPTSLHHSNEGFEPHLWPIPQLMTTPYLLTHWARPGIEPISSWILVGFITHQATMWTPLNF